MALKNAWHDPVWSGVIAGGIVAIAQPILWAMGGYAFTDRSPWGFLFSFDLPNLVFGILVVLIVGLGVSAYRKWRETKDRVPISSEQWFKIINDKLKECGFARAYLRRFDHPNDFTDSHKKVLNEMMQTLKQRLDAGADIQLISFNSENGKTGADWLKDELSSSDVNDYIKVVQKQPIGNSSTIYLFDDRLLVYSKKTDSGMLYFYERQGESIMFEFVRRGFEEYWRNL